MSEELTEAQKTVLQAAMKKYERNLKTYAMDMATRAIVVSEKIPADQVGKTIISLSDQICEWICESPKEWPIPTQDEAANMVEQMKATGEIQ